jgi:hypothetical protein
MIKFNEWNLLVESASSKDIEEFADLIAKQLEDDLETDFYVLPEFDKFTRDGEPTQIGYLLTNDEARSMRLNFTEEGDLYSVDYWKPKSDEPSVTVYLNDVPVEKAISKLIAFYKNPTPSVKEDEEVITSKVPSETKEADKKVIKAQKEVEYEFQNPREIFEDLETYINMVVDGDMYSLLLTGQAGVGKTFLVTKTLNDRGLVRNEDYFKITGKTTAAGMYMLLYQHNGKMIIFDDCDSVFQDDNAVNVLKGALDTSKVREIAWTSAIPLKTPDKSPIPKRFDFTGKVIFISNLPKRKIDPAIRSRSFVLEVALSKEDMITRMWSLLSKVQLPSGIFVSGTIRRKAMNMIVKAAEKDTNIDLNMRTLIKAISIVNKIADESVAERLIRQQCAGA